MMKPFLIKFSAFLFLLSLASCLSMGVNFKHKTPKRAAKPPKFTLRDSLVGYNGPLRNCFDVRHYDIHLRLDPKQKNISGYVTTHFDLVKESKRIQLDLDEQMVIDSIKQDKKKLAFTRKYTAIFIDLLSETKQQSITVYYHGKPLEAKRPPWEGGFVWKRDKNKKPFAGVACEGNGAKAWLPIKTYLGDEPDSVSMYFTAPGDLMVVSNGNLVSVEELKSSNEKTFHWRTSYSVNPYDITFYLGDYRLIEESYTCLDGQEMMLNYYVLPENVEKAKEHFKQAPKILKVYEQLFGTYPWPKDGYKLVESPYEGMEHQTAIAYGYGYKNTPRQDFDYIILHETAHEWWGNAVSVSDFSDVWIHEGIATYAEALYVEKTKGHRAYLDYIWITSVFVMNKKPLIGPPGLYYWNYKDQDPYSKGAVMLHTLRTQINNDTLFFSILKIFFKNNCYKNTDTKAFIALVNEMTGRDMNYFFDQYLYRRESPYLLWNFYYDRDLGKTQLIYKLDRVDPNFKMTVEAEQEGSRFYIYPTTQKQSVILPHGDLPVLMNSNYSYLQNGYKRLKK